ncbi:hypothetical protein ABK040_003570 [Willaertia magna]
MSDQQQGTFNFENLQKHFVPIHHHHHQQPHQQHPFNNVFLNNQQQQQIDPNLMMMSLDDIEQQVIKHDKNKFNVLEANKFLNRRYETLKQSNQFKIYNPNK